eukprot:s1460_g12.t1
MTPTYFSAPYVNEPSSRWKTRGKAVPFFSLSSAWARTVRFSWGWTTGSMKQSGSIKMDSPYGDGDFPEAVLAQEASAPKSSSKMDFLD